MNQKLYISIYHYTLDLVHCRYLEIKGLASVFFGKKLKFFMQKISIVTKGVIVGKMTNPILESEIPCKIPAYNAFNIRLD